MNTRHLSAFVFVGLLVVTAGCSGFGGGAETTPTATDPTTQSSGTATPTPDDDTATPTAEPEGDSRDHENDAAGSSADAAATGKMAVVVDGERVDLSEAMDGSRGAISMDEEAPDTWHANESVTLQTALSRAGVDATASSLSYEGETYEESQDETTVVYRVDGESVKPGAYELEDGDEVWVLVLTPETDASTPGDYIPPERLHVHGSMEFEVNGESLDFGREKWQAASHNSHFHFEGGHADPWHAHSWSVTPAYALSTLEDVEVGEDGVTYDGTTYSDADAGTTVSVTVNGDPVDPTEYHLKDGDSVRVTIESED